MEFKFINHEYLTKSVAKFFTGTKENSKCISEHILWRMPSLGSENNYVNIYVTKVKDVYWSYHREKRIIIVKNVCFLEIEGPEGS